MGHSRTIICIKWHNNYQGQKSFITFLSEVQGSCDVRLRQQLPKILFHTQLSLWGNSLKEVPNWLNIYAFHPWLDIACLSHLPPLHSPLCNADQILILPEGWPGHSVLVSFLTASSARVQVCNKGISKRGFPPQSKLLPCAYTVKCEFVKKSWLNFSNSQNLKFNGSGQLTFSGQPW